MGLEDLTDQFRTNGTASAGNQNSLTAKHFADFMIIKFDGFTAKKVIKVNVDDNPEIAQRYGVMSIPMLAAIKDGETAATTLGFQPKEALQQVVNAAL